MSALWRGGMHWLSDFVLSVTGLVMLLSLPAVWLAWKPWVLGAVAVTGLAAAVIHCVVLAFEQAPAGGVQGPLRMAWPHR